jgi:MFS family permease
VEKRQTDGDTRMLVLAVLAQVASSPGQTFLVALFIASFQKDLSLSAGAVSAGYLIGTLGGASLQIGVGRGSDRFGPQRTMALSALGLGWVCVAMRWANGWASLTLLFFLLRLLGQGALSLTSGHTLALYYSRRLGSAEGVRLASMGVTMASLPALVAYAIERFGWTATYALLGVAVWLLVLPLSLVLGRVSRRGKGRSLTGGSDSRRSLTLTQALRTPAYWLLLGTAIAHPMVATGIIFHLQALAASAGAAAPGLLTLFGVVSTLSTLTSGRLADAVPSRGLLFAAGLLLSAAAFGGCLGNAMALYAAVATLALGTGLHGAVVGPTVARAFGSAHHGALRSSLSTAGIAGSSVGPVLLGLSMDAWGSLQPGLWLLGGFAAAVGASFLVFGAALRRGG